MGCITKQKLYRAKRENLERLARALSLRPEGMSHEQLARLVYRRLTRREDGTAFARS